MDRDDIISRLEDIKSVIKELEDSKLSDIFYDIRSCMREVDYLIIDIENED